MPNAFNFGVSPFDCLTQAEQNLVRDNLDIAYFRAGEVLLEVGDTPRHLFVLIKGYVQQFEGEELLETDKDNVLLPRNGYAPPNPIWPRSASVSGRHWRASAIRPVRAAS